MFRLWCRTLSESNAVTSETVIEDGSDSNRTKKVLDSLEKACLELDLAKPLWLENNINEFKRYAKTRFRKENFIESVDFSSLEIQIIEE